MRVLVIEDNRTNLDLMAYLLNAAGHEVLTATTAKEGIDLALSTTPDLILCDIQLPDQDGFHVLRAVRGISELDGAAVVAVTAYAMVGDRERILGAGFDRYLAKPIEPETFLAELPMLDRSAGHMANRAARD